METMPPSFGNSDRPAEPGGGMGIVGDSTALQAALARMRHVAPTDSTVLVSGETGTGKELIARAIHHGSSRYRFPLITINCSALPAALVESELFGHERGAFTGALAQRLGRFDLAHRGTLFLDEIGDISLEVQAKLLRVLQYRTFERLGSSQTRTVDVRIVAATNRDLRAAVAAGTFREDLYYRLSVYPIRLPPLRDRRDDIPALVWSIVRRRQSVMGRSIGHIPATVFDALQRRAWPGNVRELENVIERALIHSAGDVLLLADEDDEIAPYAAVPELNTLLSVQRAHIQDVLRACDWRINGSGNAAERLGMHPNTLRFRMKKLGITRVPPSAATPSLFGPAQSPARRA
jgi:transcriptional regulator with GAF, ATPase, and Fis domain